MFPDAADARPEVGPLTGTVVSTHGDDVATAHAVGLLCSLGARPVLENGLAVVGGEQRSSGADWALSGAMALTGRENGPPLVPAGAPASALRGALMAMRALLPADEAQQLAQVDVRLLGERAAITGLSRQGPQSPGGAFRILRATDGWVGVNLPRRADVELLPALTNGEVGATLEDDWASLRFWLARRRTQEVTERARLLGLPLVKVPDDLGESDEQLESRWGLQLPGWVQLRFGGPRQGRRGMDGPLVVCLASLWAGPLAAHLLGLAGFRVVTVESRGRPDGARHGPSAFHDLLHAGQEMIGLDLPDPSEVDVLRQLVSLADLVIDGSRPRAMRQLGIDVHAAVAAGTSWMSITGYGRTGPWADVPAFGDDAAAAAGLVAWDDRGPVPAGDAIADPLAGVHAALVGLAVLRDRRAWLVDLAMREVARQAALLPTGDTDGMEPSTVAAPVARQPAGAARPLGADTEAVLTELGIRP